MKTKRQNKSIWVAKKQAKPNLALVITKPLIELQNPEKAAGQLLVKTVGIQIEKQSEKLEKYEKNELPSSIFGTKMVVTVQQRSGQLWQAIMEQAFDWKIESALELQKAIEQAQFTLHEFRENEIFFKTIQEVLKNKLNLYYPIIADILLEDIFEKLSELWKNIQLIKRDDQKQDKYDFKKQERAEKLRQAFNEQKFKTENNPEEELQRPLKTAHFTLDEIEEDEKFAEIFWQVLKYKTYPHFQSIMDTSIKEIPEKLKCVWENVAMQNNDDSYKEVGTGQNIRDAHQENENSDETCKFDIDQLKEKKKQDKEKQRLNRLSKSFIQEAQRKLNRVNREAKESAKRVIEMSQQLQTLTDAVNTLMLQSKIEKTDFKRYRCNQFGHIARNCTNACYNEIYRRPYPNYPQFRRGRFRGRTTKNYFRRSNFDRKLSPRGPNFESNQNLPNSESSDSENYSGNTKIKSRNDCLGAAIFNKKVIVAENAEQ